MGIGTSSSATSTTRARGRQVGLRRSYIVMASSAIVLVAIVASGCGRVRGATISGRPASCQPSANPGTVVDLATLETKTELNSACYAVAANVPVVLRFVNGTTTLSGKPVRLNLSVYRSQGDGYSVGEDGGIQVDPSRAVFVGSEILGGTVAEYRLPALSEGLYWVQSDSIPTVLHAWLVAS